MKIKLLHAVLHDGHRVEAGETGDIDPAIAEGLIASGAAVAVAEEDPQPAPAAGTPAPKAPEPLLQPEVGQSAANTTVPAEAKPAGTDAAPAADPKAAEAETKPAKAKEGK